MNLNCSICLPTSPICGGFHSATAPAMIFIPKSSSKLGKSYSSYQLLPFHPSTPRVVQTTVVPQALHRFMTFLLMKEIQPPCQLKI